jgi:hypothetical protein
MERPGRSQPIILFTTRYSALRTPKDSADGMILSFAGFAELFSEMASRRPSLEKNRENASFFGFWLNVAWDH